MKGGVWIVRTPFSLGSNDGRTAPARRRWVRRYRPIHGRRQLDDVGGFDALRRGRRRLTGRPGRSGHLLVPWRPPQRFGRRVCRSTGQPGRSASGDRRRRGIVDLPGETGSCSPTWWWCATASLAHQSSSKSSVFVQTCHMLHIESQ